MASSIGRDTQSAIYRGGAVGKAPIVPSGWDTLESAAREAMSADAWAYVAGSAGRETTASANLDAFDRWRIVPRMLRDVSERDLSIELFGKRYPSPVIAAPIGVLELAHPDADLGIARAAASLGIPYVASNQASVSFDETFAATPGAPHWFQLYWSSSDELVESLIARAESAGAEAIVITLDTHMLGWRPRDLDAAYLPFAHGLGIAQYTADPVFRRLVVERAQSPDDSPSPRINSSVVRTLLDMTRHYPGGFWGNLRSKEPRAAVDVFLDVFSRSSLTWKDLAFVRSRTALPILLKGIQHPDDARLAIENRMDGIIVSNHGGRQLDRATGSLDALPGIVAAVKGRLPVLFDSGIRSGADILVALALGARGVLVGRPYVYGLAIAGEVGAETVLRNLIAEFDLSLGLSGNTSVAELNPATLTEVPA
ncbi:MAG TPA: lactate 2-monooxygenase [Galbitalea sp.]|jgi:isopentenyl diphosphate isomerase/L-lactate dehydrogenase-like FMN-dependent dehydrogenase|nr:lactate 2-monooxygenase [Galbitalea sp.]